MCGIVGGVVRDAARAKLLARNAPAMLKRIGHRGRDGSGLRYFSPNGNGGFESVERPADRFGEGSPCSAVLGHVRLAVLDPTDAGLQPMASAGGEAWITYNGEIYNFVELRDQLEAEGHAFHTGTDTEVLLAAYRAWGLDALRRFNGMFGFALLDTSARRLILARDPPGSRDTCPALNPLLAAPVMRYVRNICVSCHEFPSIMTTFVATFMSPMPVVFALVIGSTDRSAISVLAEKLLPPISVRNRRS